MKNKEKKQRKLTETEEKRKAQFDKTVSSMEDLGYKMTNLTIGIVNANVMAIVLCLPIVIALMFGYVSFNNTSFGVSDREIMIFFIAFLVLTVVHELIHGISWAMFAKKGWKSISFGFIVKSFTPYCTCNDPLTRSQYIFGSIMPLIVLGVIPSIIGILIGSNLIFGIGLFMILAGGGDLTILLKLLMHKSADKDIVYLDHPVEVGLVVFSK